MHGLFRSRKFLLFFSSTVLFILIICATRLLPKTTHAQFPQLSASHSVPDITPREAAANATLGFQKLLVVSTGPSWRTRGLAAAANLTGLQLSIPPQPQNPQEFVRAFEKIGAQSGARSPDHGSAMAWLAHLELLKHVIATELETAFIMEDDMDWDVRIKDEIRLISDNIRNYTHVLNDDRTPYGTEYWDVLWLGHCGSSVDDGMPEPLSYQDDSRCKTDLYSGWSKRFLREKINEGHRLVQRSGRVTVCTFGYGVTKSSAQKILGLIGDGIGEAFDVSLAARCSERKLRCLVINPQVFNHYEPPANEGYQSLVHVGNNLGEEGDELRFEQKMGTTGNIMQSARCRALYNDSCMRPPSEI
ncbi:glycosyltransferase family 25 protein [Xylariaceae sp. AK1471]|nr:glycosyltransferase family 25 protein [Xylariaceae sp. AK1471]